MKILTIIPARKNSKRLPGKNVKLLDGIPLVEYMIKTSTSLPENFHVVVNSDDDKVADLTKKYPRVSFHRRPDELAEDSSPAIDYVRHSLSLMEDIQFDAVLILQATSPFTSTEDILNCVKLFIEERPDSVVSVVQVNHMFHPDKFKVFGSARVLVDYFVEERAMEYNKMDKVYVRNCSIYLSDINVICKDNKIIGTKCLGYEMPASRSIDINDALDFEFAEYLLYKATKC